MDYKKMSLPELRDEAKSRGIKGISTLRKPEIIELLEKDDKNRIENPKFTVKSAAPEAKSTENTEKKNTAAKDKADAAAVPVKEDAKAKEEERREVEKAAPENQSAKPVQESQSAKPVQESQQARTVSDKSGKNEPVKNQFAAQKNYQIPGQQARRSNPGFPQQNGYQQNNYRQQGGYQQNNYRQQNYTQNYNQNYNNQNYNNQNYNNQNFNNQGFNQGYNQGYNQNAGAYHSAAYNTPTYNNQYNNPGYPTQQNFPQQNYPAHANVPLENLVTNELRTGILEVSKTDGFAFIRCDNYLPGEDDVYVSPTMVRKYGLRTGDMVKGFLKEKSNQDKFRAVAIIDKVNDLDPEAIMSRPNFSELTPEFPHERVHLETPGCSPAMRIVDLISPVGKGQRGMIVSQPKAGKTTLLKQIANAITRNHPDMHIIILLIDERPEEVTDIKESIQGNQVEVIYSTFDELPDNHKRVSEMVIERAKRLVEKGEDVCILLDSITRLARAYNLTVENSGRTLSGGLDPSALHMPKKFFGAARCMREGGSLTILATALVDTGSRMDDVVFEEFKGTGNMELVLDRSLSERRIFPAIDLPKSGTRREDLLLTPNEYKACFLMRQALNGAKSEDAIELILNHLRNTKTNEEFVDYILAHGIFGNAGLK